jgi:hypothetical protein
VTCALIKDGEKLAQISDIKDGQIYDILSLDFALPGGANLNLKLAINILQAMCVLLDQLRQQAGWGEAILNVKNSPAEEQSLEIKTTTNISIH